MPRQQIPSREVDYNVYGCNNAFVIICYSCSIKWHKVPIDLAMVEDGNSVGGWQNGLQLAELTIIVNGIVINKSHI